MNRWPRICVTSTVIRPAMFSGRAAHPGRRLTSSEWMQRRKIAPGIFLLPTISQVTGTLELREISLAIRGPQGLIIVDGCSHAGVEKSSRSRGQNRSAHPGFILEASILSPAPDPEAERISAALHDQWKLDYIAIGHCTGEPTFAALQKDFRHLTFTPASEQWSIFPSLTILGEGRLCRRNC